MKLDRHKSELLKTGYTGRLEISSMLPAHWSMLNTQSSRYKFRHWYVVAFATIMAHDKRKAKLTLPKPGFSFIQRNQFSLASR